jgi:hypothetical protein
MSEDVPLTAFDSGGESEESDESEENDKSEQSDESEQGDQNEASDRSEREESAEDDPTETPSLTYTALPDGAACAACGETVEKRWCAGEGGVTPDESEAGGVKDPDALVCPGCKEW